MAPRTKEIVVNRLLETVETNARKEGLSLCFTNVMDDEDEVIRLLRQNGYGRVFGHPLNYLDIEWSSFEGYRDYLKNVSFNAWKIIKREMNKNKKEGVMIETLEDLDGYENRLYELINNNYCKHNGMPMPFKRGFLKTLKENLGKDAVIYVARKKGQLTAVSLFLKRNRVGFMPVVGVDHELSGNDFTYFNIAYYRPIMDAISDRMKRLYLGKAMYELKARRGCKLMPTYLYYRTFNRFTNLAVKPWFALLSARYKRKIPPNAVKGLQHEQMMD
jgi:predicted N-acyltransferase